MRSVKRWQVECTNRLTQQSGLLGRAAHPVARSSLTFSLSVKTAAGRLARLWLCEVPQSVKQFWQQHLDAYLRDRRSLVGLILLVDSRHPPKPFDLAMMEWANTADLQLHVLLTKADKLSKNQGQQALFKFRQSARGSFSSQLFSAANGLGLPELTETLERWFTPSEA